MRPVLCIYIYIYMDIDVHIDISSAVHGIEKGGRNF